MMPGRLAILDPAAGLSGDMLLGALLDAGLPVDWLQSLPARLGFADVEIAVHRVLRCGVSATKVEVRLPSGVMEGPSPAYGGKVAGHAHDHAHHHPHDAHPHEPQGHHHHGPGGHRHLADLLAIVERAEVTATVKARAAHAFRLLCEAEGRVHGVAPESVALHEVGAVDALVDIVGVLEGFERLGVARVATRPVTLGTGWVRAAHGVMAVPAPVVTQLLAGVEIGPNGPVTGEATTPTGAVLLRALEAGPPPARWRMLATGWGAGTRDPHDYPNALRLLVAEEAAEAGQVITVAADLDDLSPEYMDPLREALVAAGGLDVQVWATQMKKGRPGFRVEVICDTGAVSAVTEAFFLHSTTAGVRRSVAERVTLPRRQIEVEAPDGSAVRVKVLDTPAGPRVKAEFDDVRRAASAVGRPALEMAREIEARARAQVAGTAPGRSRSL